MRVQFVARHCKIPPSIRRRAEEQIRDLQRFDSRLSSASLVFDAERHLKKVEGVLVLDGTEPAVAQGEADEFKPALEQAVNRLGRILRRRRDQVTDHRAPKLSEVVGEAE